MDIIFGKKSARKIQENIGCLLFTSRQPCLYHFKLCIFLSLQKLFSICLFIEVLLEYLKIVSFANHSGPHYEA